MQFNFNSTEPIYLQVAEQITEAIFARLYVAGDQVPSTTEVSKKFHINPATILKGMNLLVAQGLIEKRRGIGMFVTADAYQKIVKDRKNKFYDQKIIGIVREAKKLGIAQAELINLIERGFSN
ncbi:GntR family transcriptional regulator [Liquorilactobacillus vini]|uniref:GntR family transcriptional regulator n=1 Tax=Liquorilactobacillus vini TaxID=238015 RepID=UPI0002E5710D|nr:GntR family transcriptional regulator [Liquorilactobacillus vini]